MPFNANIISEQQASLSCQIPELKTSLQTHDADHALIARCLTGFRHKQQAPGCRQYWCNVQQDIEELRKKAPKGSLQGPKVVAGSLLALRSIRVASVSPEGLQESPNRFPFADRSAIVRG